MFRIIPISDIHFDRDILLRLTQFFSHLEGTSLLYSGLDSPYSTQSFLCLFPYERLWIQDNKLWKGAFEKEECLHIHRSNPWDALKTQFCSAKKSNEHPFPNYVGYFSYEMGAFSDPQKILSLLPSPIPSAYFQRCTLIIAVDHSTSRAQLIISGEGIDLIGENERQWVKSLSDPAFWTGFMGPLLNGSRKFDHSESETPFTIEAHESFPSYCKKVLHAKELIKEGEIYQVNLSQKFTLRGKRNPFVIFENLAKINPAPFSAYLKLKHSTIVSSSPESFLRKKNNVLQTRPIKGTAPRGKTAVEDEQNREELLASSKNRAELLMITDLMRNDLGKISQTGSVKTKDIWQCETYANVFHLVSTIFSNPLPDIHEMDMIRACFPGGSITGCPKLRAMEVISRLENRPRGIYTGSIGYFAGNGDFDFNIAIRTMTICEDSIDLQLGGAIVADSDPEKEYAETFYKGASIFQVLGVQLNYSAFHMTSYVKTT